MTATFSAETSAITLCAEGAMLADAGDTAGSIACYARAIELAPSVLALHLILANSLLLDGRTVDARAALRHALRVASRPDAASEFTLGKALVDAGAGADAEPCFRRVRAEFPGDAGAASAHAAALRDAQRPEEAWDAISAALRMAPNEPVALLTAAMIRHDLSDFTGALHWCEKSLAVRPDSSGARVTRGYLRQLLGDSDGGWSDFEARALPVPNTAAERWRGESLEGKSLLVIGEQGVGDQFQFLRYVHHPIVQVASRVIVSCQTDAVSLLRTSGYNAVPRDVTVFTDYYAPLLSLPVILGVGADWRGAGDVYLTVPDARTRERKQVKRVGIVWAGNPAHRNDAVRSMSPELWHSLLHSRPEVQFVCLQHGLSGRDVPMGTVAAPPCRDWLDTARQLCRLDLLITVDTGIAHLAGALGVPVWLLVSHVPDWRWGISGSSTPWYASVRLFRQPARGDWSRVLTNVNAALSGADVGG